MPLTPHQLELRRKAIGASEIAALAGLSRWATPIQIYEAKRTGQLLEATLPMELGILLEEPIAQVYASRTKRHVRKVYTLQNPRYPFAVATPDRAVFAVAPPFAPDGPELGREDLADAERLLQVKSTTWRMAKEWGTPGTDEVPEDYLAQVTWEMGVSEKAISDFGVLFDKDRFDVFTVHFNAELFAGLYEIGERFMRDHVNAGIPPPPDASEQYKEFLSRAFPREATEDLIPVADGSDLEIAMWSYAMLKLIEKRTKAGLQRYRNLITAAIGARTGLLAAELGRMTWKKTRDKSTVDYRAAYQDARTLAALLLERFGPQLPAEERETLVEQLQGIEATHKKTTPGHRMLHCGWSKEFKERIPLDFDDAVNVAQLLAAEHGAEEDDSGDDQS